MLPFYFSSTRLPPLFVSFSRAGLLPSWLSCSPEKVLSESWINQNDEAAEVEYCEPPPPPVKGPDGECLGCSWSLLSLNHPDSVLRAGS